MGRKKIDVDINRIREIQRRIKIIQKDIYKETQAEFAFRIGLTIDEYKNRINESKLPKDLESYEFQKRIVENTCVTKAYLKLEVDNPFETKEGIKENPIDFEDKGNILNALITKLSSNHHLTKALHFFLLELPPIYTTQCENFIISMYDFLSKYTLIKNQDYLTELDYTSLLINLKQNNNTIATLITLESKANKLYLEGDFQEAIKTYLSTLSLLYDENAEINELFISNPFTKRIAKRIYYINKISPFLNKEYLSNFQQQILACILNLSSKNFE